MKNKIFTSEFFDELNKVQEIEISQMAGITEVIFEAVNESISNGLSDQLLEQLKVINDLSESCFIEYNLYEDEEKQKIYYFAAIKTLVNLLEKKCQENNQKEFFIRLANSSNYIRPIMKYFNDQRSASEKELKEIAKVNNIPQNNISEIMQDLCNSGLLSKILYDKKEIYFINEQGIKFCHIINKYDINQELECIYSRITSCLLECIYDEIELGTLDTDNIMIKLNRKNLLSIPGVDSYIFKKQLDKVLYAVKKGCYNKRKYFNNKQIESLFQEKSDTYTEDRLYMTDFIPRYLDYNDAISEIRNNFKCESNKKLIISNIDVSEDNCKKLTKKYCEKIYSEK